MRSRQRSGTASGGARRSAGLRLLDAENPGMPVSGRLILLSGLGSVLGPLIGMGLMARFGIDGVFYLMSAAALLVGLGVSQRDNQAGGREFQIAYVKSDELGTPKPPGTRIPSNCRRRLSSLPSSRLSASIQ